MFFGLVLSSGDCGWLGGPGRCPFVRCQVRKKPGFLTVFCSREHSVAPLYHIFTAATPHSPHKHATATSTRSSASKPPLKSLTTHQNPRFFSPLDPSSSPILEFFVLACLPDGDNGNALARNQVRSSFESVGRACLWPACLSARQRTRGFICP